MTELIQRTNENWTWGIVNIPLLYGHDNRLGVNPKTIIRKVAHNARCYSKPYYALDKSQRYLWYELDTTDITQHIRVLDLFASYGIDVYHHRTMKGFHYITMHLMYRLEYETFINRLKNEYNNGTFFYSLRIIPNKWMGEQPLWFCGHIHLNGSNHEKELKYVQSAIEQPYVFNYNRTIPKTVQMLDNMFCISRYQFKMHLRR